MQNARNVAMLVVVTAGLSLAAIGCGSKDQTTPGARSDPPKTEHPRADHPKGEHPK